MHRGRRRYPDVRTPRDVLPESGSGAPMVCRHVPWSGNAADSSSTWVCSDDAHRLELAHGAKMRNFIADTVDHTVSAVINIKLAPVLTKNTSQQTEIDDLIKDMDKPYGKISYIQEDIKANKSAVSRLNAMLRGELRGKTSTSFPRATRWRNSLTMMTMMKMMTSKNPNAPPKKNVVGGVIPVWSGAL